MNTTVLKNNQFVHEDDGKCPHGLDLVFEQYGTLLKRNDS